MKYRTIVADPPWLPREWCVAQTPERRVSARRVPPMPEGFIDRTAWEAIHWRFSDEGSALDEAMIAWQCENQERIRAALDARTAA